MKQTILTGVLCAIASASISWSAQAKELDVSIAPAPQYNTASYDNAPVEIARIEDTGYLADDDFGSSTQACPPYCINPLILSEDVRTVDELEVIRFIETSRNGSSLIVDTRTPGWYQRGTIPGSVNIPFTKFEKSENDVELAEVLERLGARQRHDVGMVMRMLERIGLFNGAMKTERWDYTAASDVLLWCNGPWCGQTPRAIKALLSHGYPAEKLHYYRGGIQTWQSLGLTTVMPAKAAAMASR